MGVKQTLAMEQAFSLVFLMASSKRSANFVFRSFSADFSVHQICFTRFLSHYCLRPVYTVKSFCFLARNGFLFKKGDLHVKQVYKT